MKRYKPNIMQNKHYIQKQRENSEFCSEVMNKQKPTPQVNDSH